MSKYSTLRAAITADIYENTNESITGAVLQARMLDIVNALDLGSLFLGVATAATVPSSEANGFYLALTGGTYANFLTSGGTEITVDNREIAIIVPDGNAWRKIRILKLTSTVTENSEDVPDGGAIFNALAQKQPLLTAGDGITIDKDNVIHATVVEANPQGETPDADLDALKVGDKVYSIPQGGTSDYDALEHKPSINSQPLSGNMTSQQLGLQDRLVSGTTIKTINGQPVLGSGNLNTANGYIHADDVTGMPEPSADYASKICLVPSTQNQGSLDQYACIENAVVEGRVVSGWSWVLIGTTAPIVSVQRVDVLRQLIVANFYTGQQVSTNNGTLFDSTNVDTYEYNIPSGVEKIFVTFVTIANSTQKFVHFYDENGFMTGESQLDNNTSANISFNDEPLQVPQGAIMVRMCVSKAYSLTNQCLAEQIVEQSLVKQLANANTIIYGEVSIDTALPINVTSGSEIVSQSRRSGFGIMFPGNYSNIGKPTQVIAMLHGSTGYVSAECLGYTKQEWVTWRNQYLAAGFAVMDINGMGVSTTNDTFSKPYGNPQCVETLQKAFDYIRCTYNVCDKLLLHGTSMGGTNAMAFMLAHPNLVLGAALFAPAIVQYGIKFKGWGADGQAAAWGYNTTAEMIADNFSNCIGYQPMMEDDFDWEHMTSEEYLLLGAKTRLADVPIRIWQGVKDQSVPKEQNIIFVNCLRRANVPVTLRQFDSNGNTTYPDDHTMSGGANSIVRNEAVSWFKRFVD